MSDVCARVYVCFIFLCAFSEPRQFDQRVVFGKGRRALFSHTLRFPEGTAMPPFSKVISGVIKSCVFIHRPYWRSEYEMRGSP